MNVRTVHEPFTCSYVGRVGTRNGLTVAIKGDLVMMFRTIEFVGAYVIRPVRLRNNKPRRTDCETLLSNLA